jgi:hypothetical protein
VDNAPPTPDIIALSLTGPKTLTFSQPIDNLLFAILSLNGNGYQFDNDFDPGILGLRCPRSGGSRRPGLPGQCGRHLRLGTSRHHPLYRRHPGTVHLDPRPCRRRCRSHLPPPLRAATLS